MSAKDEPDHIGIRLPQKTENGVSPTGDIDMKKFPPSSSSSTTTTTTSPDDGDDIPLNTIRNNHIKDDRLPNEGAPSPPQPLPRSTTKTTKTMSTEWVKFDEDDNKKEKQSDEETKNIKKNQSSIVQKNTSPAVMTATESIQMKDNQLSGSSIAKNSLQPQPITQIPTSQPAVIETTVVNISPPTLRTIELPSGGRVHEGFANGDMIVSLFPVNTKWPWITPAVFRPELVPEELMAQGLTLTVEEYVHAMETLVNDYRFALYNVCYKRVLVCWILFAFCVLLALLFSGLDGIALFTLGVGWLFLNAAAIFFCMWTKLRLSRGLEKCLALVNKQLIRHKILLALDDRGKISCHKVNLCFMYFDPAQCIAYLNEFIERNEQNGTSIELGWEARMDLSANDIVIQSGSNTTRHSTRKGLAEEIYLRYLQRWGKDFLRRRLDWTLEENTLNASPRHLQVAMCPCQYSEEILLNKPKKDPRSCWTNFNNWLTARGLNCC